MDRTESPSSQKVPLMEQQGPLMDPLMEEPVRTV